MQPTENNTFEATDASGKKYTARKVVLGTGLRDVLPETPGVAEAWGKGIYWCPWCDGYEHRDQPIGILGGFLDIIGSIQELYSTLNKDMIAFLNGTQVPEQEVSLQSAHPDWKAIVDSYGIRLDNRTITSIERIQNGEEHKDDQGRQFDKFLVHFTEGEPVERNAFITNFATEQLSTLPKQLGLNMLGSKIDTQTNSGLRTSLAGVWAVGDANSDNSTNVPHAMFSGKRAAVYAHGELLLSYPLFLSRLLGPLGPGHCIGPVSWLHADSFPVEMAREEAKNSISKRMLDRRALEKEADRQMGNEVEALYNKMRRDN